MTRRARWGLWGPAVAVALIGAALGAWKSPPGSQLIWDKLAHAASYFVLALTLLRATHGGIAPPRPRPTSWALLLSIGHGVGVELMQALIPWREASVGDAVADAIGAIAAAALLAAGFAMRPPPHR